HVDNADELGVETSYEWTFGDGQSAQTLNRSIAHDYSAALTLPNDLDVVASVTARMPDGSSAESSIRIVVRNSYREMAKPSVPTSVRHPRLAQLQERAGKDSSHVDRSEQLRKRWARSFGHPQTPPFFRSRQAPFGS